MELGRVLEIVLVFSLLAFDFLAHFLALWTRLILVMVQGVSCALLTVGWICVDLAVRFGLLKLDDVWDNLVFINYKRYVVS